MFEVFWIGELLTLQGATGNQGDPALFAKDAKQGVYVQRTPKLSQSPRPYGS